jgi:ribosomal protein S18 acetylase RimI-like enzyme
VSVLFREYAEALAVDLSFQNFEKELAELPGEYAPPEGALLLALAEENSPSGSSALRRTGPAPVVRPFAEKGRRLGGRSFSSDKKVSSSSGVSTPEAQNLILSAICGCVALRKIDCNVCEMKRLYVRGTFRGRGVGRALALAVIDSSRISGYHAMRLDTLPQMGEAQALYSSLGFRETPPYRYNPIPGSRFLELALV